MDVYENLGEDRDDLEAIRQSASKNPDGTEERSTDHGFGEVEEEACRVDEPTGAIVRVGREGHDDWLASERRHCDPLVRLVAVHHLRVIAHREGQTCGVEMPGDRAADSRA
jgi:hypothetical protein